MPIFRKSFQKIESAFLYFIQNVYIRGNKILILMENSTLNKTSLNWLNEAARWARFIAILGFILIGFLIVVGLFIGPILSVLNENMDVESSRTALSGGIIAAIYIVLAIVYFFPIYYLFQFSNGFITAYKAENEEKINASFHYLKKHYKFIGIVAIITIAIYLVLFALGIFGLLMK